MTSFREPTRPTVTSTPWVLATASVITVAFMGSVLATPLYSVYQEKYGFSDITLTLVYAVYVVGNVVALVLFGQVSDQVGRRRTALPGLALAALSAVTFMLARGTPWLFAGRFLIGLAVGVLSGTGTAWLAEQLGPERGAEATVTAATANLVGIAVGPVVGGVLGEYVAGPLISPFVVYLALLAAVAVAVMRAPDSHEPSVRRVRDVRLRAEVGVPRDRLAEFATPAVTGFVTFALGGLYFALIPGMVGRDLHIENLVVGGLVVFELGAVAAVCVVLGRRVPPRTAMIGGLVALLPAVGLVVAAQAARSLPLLLLATLFAGVTMAFGYRGGLQVVNEIAPAEHRAEVASSFFTACFIGNSLPVIGIGLLARATTPLTASATFAGTVAVLAVGAMVWHRRTSR